MTAKHNNMDFIIFSNNFLTPKQFVKTVAYKIINTEPYCDCPYGNFELIGTDISYYNNMKSTTELLDFFYNKYGVSKYEKKDDNILITIN